MLPSGSGAGQASAPDVAPSSAAGVLDGSARTRNKPDPFTDPRTMESPSQVAPSGGDATVQISMAVPPRTAIFLSVRPAKNPTHSPSGDTNGLAVPSEPGIGCPLNSSRPRM